MRRNRKLAITIGAIGLLEIAAPSYGKNWQRYVRTRRVMFCLRAWRTKRCRKVMNEEPSRDVVLFAEALQLPAPERSAFLERACGDNAKLRQSVEDLLRAH